MVFYWFWVPSGTSFFIKKLEKQRFGTTRSGHQKRFRKMYDFWVAETTKSELPCRREHDFEVLSNSRKELHVEVVLVPPFGAFGVSYRRKHGFQGCLIFARFLNRLLHHFRHPKCFPKSYKMRIHFWNHFLPIRRRPIRSDRRTLSPRNPPLFYSIITQRPLRFAALPVIRHRALWAPVECLWSPRLVLWTWAWFCICIWYWILKS